MGCQGNQFVAQPLQSHASALQQSTHGSMQMPAIPGQALLRFTEPRPGRGSLQPHPPAQHLALPLVHAMPHDLEQPGAQQIQRLAVLLQTPGRRLPPQTAL
jgi:hypothetical protein